MCPVGQCTELQQQLGVTGALPRPELGLEVAAEKFSVLRSQHNLWWWAGGKCFSLRRASSRASPSSWSKAEAGEGKRSKSSMQTGLSA